jgi:hypothetical protein
MIFAFEHHLDDKWQEAYRSGEIDWKREACAWDENGKATMYKQVDGPNNTYECDYDGIRVVEDRIQNGFRLFGKSTPISFFCRPPRIILKLPKNMPIFIPV